MSGLIEIALCDDNAEDIEAEKAFVERFALEHSDYPMRISEFSSGATLLEHIENNGDFDLYILDVLMPEMSGMSLAETIRSRGEHAEIVFLTNSQDYAVDAFSVYASGYLLKPILEENFNKTMLRAVRKLAQEKSEVLTVRTKDGIRRIPLHKIVMIESFNHLREITLSDDNVLETFATLAELFDQLKDHSNFYMPHRSYIANLDNTVGIVHHDLLMLGNRHIPISKSQLNDVQDVVQDYFFKREKL